MSMIGLEPVDNTFILQIIYLLKQSAFQLVRIIKGIWHKMG